MSLLPLLALLTGSGCSWYRIQAVAPTAAQAWGEPGKAGVPGYIFYQPELYFSATITTEKSLNKAGEETLRQNITVTPLYLPNYRKPYRLTTHNFLAKANFGFDFENGWKLTHLTDQSDNSSLATSLSSQLDTLLKMGARSGPSPGLAATPSTRVLLYRPTFHGVTGYFDGFEPVSLRLDE